MISFVISACLLSDPHVCKDYSFPLDEGYDQTSCMMEAPPYVAKWTGEHPAWQVKSWKCKSGDESEL